MVKRFRMRSVQKLEGFEDLKNAGFLHIIESISALFAYTSLFTREICRRVSIAMKRRDFPSCLTDSSTLCMKRLFIILNSVKAANVKLVDRYIGEYDAMSVVSFSSLTARMSPEAARNSSRRLDMSFNSAMPYSWSTSS